MLQRSHQFRVLMVAAAVLHFLAGTLLFASVTMDAMMAVNLAAVGLLLVGFTMNFAALRKGREH